MKLLVLGGAGYVGSHTAMKLLECGYEVVVADNLVTGYKQAVPQNATFYQGDVRDRAFLNKIFKKPYMALVWSPSLLVKSGTP